MTSNIIALCGKKQSGKSTIARALIKEHGGIHLQKFSRPIKICLYSLGLSYEEVEGEGKEKPNPILCGKTPRQAMQTLGAQWGREMIGEELWINVLSGVLKYRSGLFCIDDTRYRNELEFLHKRNACSIWITPSFESYKTLKNIDTHSSENDLTPEECRYRVDNYDKDKTAKEVWDLYTKHLSRNF